VQLAPRVQPELKDQKGLKDYKVPQVLMEQLALLGLPGLQVQPGYKAHKVKPVQPARMGLPEHKVFRVYKALPVIQAHEDYKA